MNRVYFKCVLITVFLCSISHYSFAQKDSTQVCGIKIYIPERMKVFENFDFPDSSYLGVKSVRSMSKKRLFVAVYNGITEPKVKLFTFLKLMERRFQASAFNVGYIRDSAFIGIKGAHSRYRFVFYASRNTQTFAGESYCFPFKGKTVCIFELGLKKKHMKVIEDSFVKN